MPTDLYMPAGALRHPVIIFTPSASADASGAPIQAWTTLLTARASIRTLTTREALQDSQLVSDVTHIITLRYVGNANRIVSGQRVVRVIGGDVFLIQGVDNVLFRNRVLKLTCLIVDQTSN